MARADGSKSVRMVGEDRRTIIPRRAPVDPWWIHIHEAAGRYSRTRTVGASGNAAGIGGEQQATSPVGAMGLMQVMPATYEELRW